MRRLWKTKTSMSQFGQVQQETRIETYLLNEAKQFQWIRINGLKDDVKIQQLLNDFNVDPLWIEDVFYLSQRTKIETNDQAKYIVINGSTLNQPVGISRYLQLFILDHTVVSISETETDMFDALQQSVMENGEKAYEKAAFIYFVFDQIIDFFLDAELQLAHQLLELEQGFLEEEDQSMPILHRLRKEIYAIKMLAQILADPAYQKTLTEGLVIDKTLHKQYEDLFDHVHRLNVLLSEDREMVRNIFDLYNNNVANKMNQIMKTLTIFSAIFIPLSFLAGVFGMNFIDMPILFAPNALAWFFGFSGIIAILMLGVFRFKDWL